MDAVALASKMAMGRSTSTTQVADERALSELREAVMAMKAQSPQISSVGFSDGTDSGYVTYDPSHGNSPESTPETGNKAVFVDGVSVQKWDPLGLKKIRLQLFDDIPKAQFTHERFNNLKAQYTQPLFEFLRTPPKPTRNIRNIAMSLEILGKDRANARPWVLIQCRKAIAGKIRRFFKQAHVDADFRPSEPTLHMPYLPVIVHGESPEGLTRPDSVLDTLASNDDSPYKSLTVHREPHLTHSSLCGLEIKVYSNDEIHSATIGGMVCIEQHGSVRRLVALTTSHFIDIDQHRSPRGSSNQMHTSDKYEGEEDREDDEDEEDENDEDDLDIYDLYQPDTFGLSQKYLPGYSIPSEDASTDLRGSLDTARLTSSWPCVGKILRTSLDQSYEESNFDWAILRLTDDSLLLPYILDPEKRDPSMSASPDLSFRRRVEVHASEGRRLPGTLANDWSYLAMAPSHTMVRSHLLTMDNGCGLKKGDSGAWVVDPSLKEVYGHVVAADVFGRIHVIPMFDILTDIESRVPGSSVRLARREDIVWEFNNWHGSSIRSQAQHEPRRDMTSAPTERREQHLLDVLQSLDLGYDTGDSWSETDSEPIVSHPRTKITCDSGYSSKRPSRFTSLAN